MLSIEPLATAQTTGSSRWGSTPATWCALSARQPPTAFLVAILVITATSSSPVAMSSSNVSRLEATLSLGAENAAPKRFSEQRHQART